MPELACPCKEVLVERSADSALAVVAFDHHAIDVEKLVEALTEPQKMPAVVVVEVLERHEESPGSTWVATRAAAIMRSNFSAVSKEVSRALSLFRRKSAALGERSW